MKIKINKWDLIKLKSFCTAKETINKMKRQPIEWKKIFTNYLKDRDWSPKIYKYLMHNNSDKKDTIKKWSGNLNRRSLKKTYPWPGDV